MDWKKGLVAAVYACGLLIWAGDVEDHKASMKQMKSSAGALRKATEAKDNAAIATEAGKMAVLFRGSVAFWDGMGKADALKWSKDALAASEKLQAAAKEGNAEAIEVNAKAVGGSCMTCHKVYRETLPDGTYKLKM